MCGTWVNEFSKEGEDLGVLRLPVSNHEIKKHILLWMTQNNYMKDLGLKSYLL